jgi:cell division transport system permease protein
MPISARYVARETASNLWRNRLMAIAAVLTVGVSLSLVGTALLLRQAVNDQLVALGDNVNLQVFVQPNASSSTIATLRSQIAETPQIRSFTYLDHQQSYEQAKRLFEDQQGSNGNVIISALTPQTTPPVFEIQLVNPSDASTVAAVFQGQPGVYNVAFPSKSIHTLQSLSNVMQIVLFVLALVLLISAVVLMLNAIRMAIFSRRREVSVMRLVGATAWFIRLPFMTEGLVQGVLGSMLAIGIVLLGDLGIQALIHHFPLFRRAVVPGHDVLVTEIIVVIVGLVVGVAGSAVAVRRFLDV